MDRDRMATRRRRALRGLASAAIATIVAAAAHTLGGGGAPPWWLVAAVVLLSSPLAVWLVGRRMTRRGTIAAVLVAQGLLHVAFAAVGTAGPHASAGHHALSLRPLAESPLQVEHLHLSAGMILAHAIAAAVTVLLLTRGEDLLRAIARGLRRLAARVEPLPTLPAARLRVACRTVRPAAILFLSAVSRRGPPALAR